MVTNLFVPPYQLELQKKTSDMVSISQSMGDEEKEMWKAMIPKMGLESLKNLYDISETERKKLEDLEVKYQEEIRTLKEKHRIEWEKFINHGKN